MTQCQVQIVTYNSEAVILQCLAAVYAQCEMTLSVVVIDNASTDHTVERIKEAHPEVQIEHNRVNVGYAAAHNQGFARALEQGVPYVLTLNPDVLLDPQYLQGCVQAVAATASHGGRVAGVTGKLLRAADDRLDSTGLVMHAFYHVRDRGSGELDAGQYDRSAAVWGVCGAAAVYVTAFLQDMQSVDNFILDESFFLSKDDVDLCVRGSLTGCAFVYAPTARAIHRRGWRKGERVSEAAKMHSFANQLALLIAYVDPVTLSLWLALAVESARLAYLAMRSPATARAALEKIGADWEHNRKQKKLWT